MNKIKKLINNKYKTIPGRRSFFKKMLVFGGMLLVASKTVATAKLPDVKDEQNQFDYTKWPCRL